MSSAEQSSAGASSAGASSAEEGSQHPDEVREQKAPPKDPMKSFRGVLAGTLVLEAIVVGLALPVVAQLGSGITSLQGWIVLAIAVGLIAACAFLRRQVTMWLVLGMQFGLLAFVVALPSVAIVGALFLGVLLWLLKLRRDVARRMAAGSLPSQQQES